MYQIKRRKEDKQGDDLDWVRGGCREDAACPQAEEDSKGSAEIEKDDCI